MLELLLLHHAEALLLVEDDEPEVLEAHIFLQQPVGADHDIDLADLHPAQDVGRLGIRAEAREHVDLDREGLEAFAEGQEVLLGEDRGRHQDRHLFAVHHGLEGGAHRELGLPKADVAAQQPVHRTRVLHVRLDLLHHADLVRRLVVRERLLELLLPRPVLGKGMALDELPFGVEIEQVVRHGFHRLPHLALGSVPVARTQALQPRRRIAAADVFLNAVEVLDRHEQLVAICVLELHVLALLSVLAHQPHAGETPDAVVDVDDQVAGRELQVPGRRARPHHAAADPLAQSAEEVGVAVDLELLRWHPEALRHRLVAKHDQAGGQRGL